MSSAFSGLAPSCPFSAETMFQSSSPFAPKPSLFLRSQCLSPISGCIDQVQVDLPYRSGSPLPPHSQGGPFLTLFVLCFCICFSLASSHRLLPKICVLTFTSTSDFLSLPLSCNCSLCTPAVHWIWVLPPSQITMVQFPFSFLLFLVYVTMAAGCCQYKEGLPSSLYPSP